MFPELDPNVVPDSNAFIKQINKLGEQINALGEKKLEKLRKELVTTLIENP